MTLARILARTDGGQDLGDGLLYLERYLVDTTLEPFVRKNGGYRDQKPGDGRQQRLPDSAREHGRIRRPLHGGYSEKGFDETGDGAEKPVKRRDPRDDGDASETPLHLTNLTVSRDDNDLLALVFR